MKLFAKLSLVLLALSLTQPGYAEKISEKDWKQFISTGTKIQGDVMQVRASDEIEKLATKMKEAMKKNPEWAIEFMSSAPEGQPLPYNEKMGLTKKEYERLLELSQTQGAVSMQKTGAVDFTFEPLSDGRIKIVSSNSLLNNIVISTDKVVTSAGDLTDAKEINNQDPNAITGAWKGVKWSKESVNEKTMTGESIQFCIGKLEGKNQGIIYYDGKILKGTTAPPAQFSQIVFFPLAK